MRPDSWLTVSGLILGSESEQAGRKISTPNLLVRVTLDSSQGGWSVPSGPLTFGRGKSLFIYRTFH